MSKPQPKKEVAILHVMPTARCITMNASSDAARDFAEFGVMHFYENNGQYWLTVDGRYDFDEVVEYISNYDRKD